MNKTIFSEVAVISLILLLVSGCSSLQASPTGQDSLPPTVLVTVTDISDTPPVKTTQAEEAASAITATPWQMPTLAPLLSYAQASKKISSLFEATKACAVPCWWGMVPGKTTYAQVLEVNAGLVQENSPSQNGSSAPALRIIYQNDEIPFRSDTYYEFNNDVVQYIHVDSKRTSEIFALKPLYDRFGLPESSSINVYSGLNGSKHFFEVTALFEYRSKGAALLYSAQGTAATNGDITACFDNAIDPQIFLWTAENWQSYTRALYYEYRVFKPMEEVSNTNAQGFFNTIVEKGSTCINVSPLPEWPSN